MLFYALILTGSAKQPAPSSHFMAATGCCTLGRSQPPIMGGKVAKLRCKAPSAAALLQRNLVVAPMAMAPGPCVKAPFSPALSKVPSKVNVYCRSLSVVASGPYKDPTPDMGPILAIASALGDGAPTWRAIFEAIRSLAALTVFMVSQLAMCASRTPAFYL